MNDDKEKEIILKEKSQLLKFAQIIEQLKNKEKDSSGIQISLEDQTYLERIRDTYINKTEYYELIKSIMDAPLGKSTSIVEDFYKKKEKENTKEKNTEEEIAKTFGVDPSKIQHIFLKNGKEIFFFYSFELEKDIILENSNRGKSLSEILEEIQKNNEEYQLDNEEKNTDHIMMDERLKTNLELKMYSPEEAPQHVAEINLLNENEKKLLNYLLHHKEELDIKAINIENLIYITNNHEIKEISYDKNFSPTISSPESEGKKSSASQENEKKDKSPELEDSSNELNEMMKDSEKEELKENENEKKKEKEEKKAKQYVLIKKDEQGFIGYVELLLLLTSLLAILYISLKFFSII